MTNPDRRLRRIPAGMRSLLLIPVLVLLFAGGASAQSPTLFGTVGPGFTIRFVDAAGNRVSHLDPGTYTIQVEDKSPEHTFHLTGPGVDRATDIEETGTFTWTVTVTDGRYHYQCDPHSSTMRGDFAVGDVPPPSPLPVKKPPLALAASVGPTPRIVVARLGVRIRTIEAGLAVITVRDRSTKDNFHLVGPGVNRATSRLGRPTVVWRLTLRAGLYTYRSDATPALRGTFRVTP